MLHRATAAALVIAASAVAQPDREFAVPAAVPLRVAAFSPQRETCGFPRTANVSITFSTAIDPSTLNSTAFSVLGRWSGPVDGTFALTNHNRTVAWLQGRPFSAGEMVTVSISRGLRTPAGARLAKQFQFQFWVAAGPGTMTFQHVDTLDPGITPYGAFGGDLDDDGDLDLAIPNEDSEDVSIFLNDGLDQFTGPANYPVGEHCSPSEGLDFSGDGIVDIATSNILDNNVSILIGNGDGTYQTRVNYPVGSQPRGLAALDLEGDGDADLVAANRVSSTLSILRNNGNGTFAAATTFDTGMTRETGVAVADFNRDGVLDLCVIAYGSPSRIGVALNDGAGALSMQPVVATGTNPWMLVTGDVNGDGLVDAACCNAGSAQYSIHLGDGHGNLGPATLYSTGEFPTSIDLGDLDGDGDLDLSTSAFTGRRFTIYRNNGAGLFAELFRLTTPGAGSCTVFHDRDNDGDVDLTTIDEVADIVDLYRQH